MKAKILVYAFPALILTAIHLAEAQQPGKIPWIGYLTGAGSSPNKAFVEGLRDLGYVRLCENSKRVKIFLHVGLERM